jgi:AraC-like DNA-binding protein
MHEATSIDAFVANWVGKYVVGKTYLVWSFSASFGGTVFWGRPDVEDLAQLARLYALPHRDDQPWFDLVTDGSRLEWVPPDAFARFLPLAKMVLETHERRLRRHALLVPVGVSGAVVAGVLPIVGGAHEWKVFSDAPPAFAWLDRPDAAEAQVELDALIARTHKLSPALRAVREYLITHLRASAEEVARAHGFSTRSLQRELAAAGTTLRHEIDEARVRVASDLINSTELKLEAIARQIGLSSTPSLNELFRRTIGTAPGQLRQRT